jgi:putative ABC transport system permease protein
VRQGLALTFIGLGAGLVVALALTRFLVSFLYGVRPTDPATFVAVSFALAAAGLVASYIPARRATKVDPIVALRYE